MINGVSSLKVQLLTNPARIFTHKQRLQLPSSSYSIKGINKQQLVQNARAVEILNLQDNIAIILQTLKNKCVINANPSHQNISLVPNQLGEILKNLRSTIKNSYDEVIGIVTGGRAYDSSNKYADKSIEFNDTILNFLEEEKIPLTVFLEQKLSSGEYGTNVYSHKKNVVLSGPLITKMAELQSKTQDKIEDIGEQFFDVLRISPYVPVKFVNEVASHPNTNVKFIKNRDLQNFPDKNLQTGLLR